MRKTKVTFTTDKYSKQQLADMAKQYGIAATIEEQGPDLAAVKAELDSLSARVAQGIANPAYVTDKEVADFCARLDGLKKMVA